VEETRQNPGENEGIPLTAAPDAPEPKIGDGTDDLEHVLDAWMSEPSSRQRYERLRFERRDGQALDLLIDAETARDVADKLTIVAARARHRSRGAAGVPVDVSVDPGAAEDRARVQKVLDLAGLDTEEDYVSRGDGSPSTQRIRNLVGPLAEEFKASREDVTKAHAMLDEQRTKHIRDMAAIAQRHLDADRELETARKDLANLRAELESVKADRANLIAEAAQRDIEAGEQIDLTKDESAPAGTFVDVSMHTHSVEGEQPVHAGCTMPELCSCSCKTCKAVWEEAGRPASDVERVNIHDPAFRS